MFIDVCVFVAVQIVRSVLTALSEVATRLPSEQGMSGAQSAGSRALGRHYDAVVSLQWAPTNAEGLLTHTKGRPSSIGLATILYARDSG